ATFRVGADGETRRLQGSHSVQLKPRPLRKSGLFFESRPRRIQPQKERSALPAPAPERTISLTNSGNPGSDAITASTVKASSSSPTRAENAANFFRSSEGGQLQNLSSKARQATCGEAGATPIESRL